MSETVYPKRSHYRAMLAVSVREGKPQAVIDAARRDYFAAKVAEFVAEQVAKAPPLTAAQRDRIAAALVRPSSEL